MTIETTKSAKEVRNGLFHAGAKLKCTRKNGKVFWYVLANRDGLAIKKRIGSEWERTNKNNAAAILAKYDVTREMFEAYTYDELEIVEVTAQESVNEPFVTAEEVVNSEAQETVDTAAEVSESAPKTVEQAKSTIEFCEYAFRNMDLSDEAFDKCLAEYGAAKTVIDNAAKIAELKAEHDKVTEKMYADETSEATARRLRATRREIREEIKALETEQEVTEPELTANMKSAAQIVDSLGEGEVKFSHAGEGKNGGLALHYDLDDGSEFGTGISLVEVFTDKDGYILDHVNVIKLNPVKTVATYNFNKPVSPAPTDEPTGTNEEIVETTEQVTEVKADETPAAGISPDEKLAELVNAAKTAWEAQRSTGIDSPEAEAFRAAKKAITKFLDTTCGALSTETLRVADRWRESEFSGSSDLPSFVIKDIKTGKILGTYNTLAEVKAALETKQVAELPKFEAGKTYCRTWHEDTGRPHIVKYTVAKRTAKTIVLKSGARCKINISDEFGEMAKVGYNSYLYARDLYNTDVIKKQAKSDKYWDETEREVDRRFRERKALALADKIARDFQGNEPSVFSLLPDIDSLRDVDDTEQKVDSVKIAGIAKAKELSAKLLTPEFLRATIAGEPLSQMWIAFNGDDRTFHVCDGWDHDEPFDTAQQVEDYIAELKTQIDTPPAPTPAAPSYKLRPEEDVERERKETRLLGRIFDEIFQEELAAAKAVDTFAAKESELKENIGFALDAQADAAANLAFAKNAYDNAQFQFSVAEDIKIKAEQSYREFVFGEAERLNKLPLVDKVCAARDLRLTVSFDIKTQLFKVEHGIAAVAGAKITLGAFKTPALVESFLLSLLPADDDPPPKPATDDFLATRKALWNKYLTAEAETQKALQDADFENCDPDTKLALLNTYDADAQAYAEYGDFMSAAIKKLRDEIGNITCHGIKINGKEPGWLWTDLWNGKFRVVCWATIYAEYDTPAQVVEAVRRLKEAMARGDDNFTFPTVVNLTEQNSCLMETDGSEDDVATFKVGEIYQADWRKADDAYKILGRSAKFVTVVPVAFADWGETTEDNCYVFKAKIRSDERGEFFNYEDAKVSAGEAYQLDEPAEPPVIDPLAEIDAAEYAISPDALTFAVYEEEGQAYIARRKRETLADAKLAKAYAKAKKVIKIARYKDGRLEWQARKKNGEWSRNEFYAKRKLGEFGIEWIEFLTFQEAEAEAAKSFREKAPDSLARAMETALLKVQEHCRKHDLKAAQREMAIYGICSEALRTLGKEV